MEGLKQRSFILAGVLLAAGVFALMRTSQASESKLSEAQMQELAPTAVPGYQVVPGPEGIAYSYKMEKSTYETLKPFGIVARQYTGETGPWDVVLISSDSHESFHDPKICFSGQGWTFDASREETLELPDKRQIPMTVVEMTGPVAKSLAVYFYKGPKGFVANPKRLQMDMFSEVLVGKKPVISTFYRFMPSSPGADLVQMKEFIKSYMTAAQEQSGGVF
jgi:hypothetical protein